MIKDLCHVLSCEEPATDIQWCPGLDLCIQVCEIHAFDTLGGEVTIDIRRANDDHKRNIDLYQGAVKQ